MAANQTRRWAASEAGSRSGARALANVSSPSFHRDAAEAPHYSARQVREQSDQQFEKLSHTEGNKVRAAPILFSLLYKLPPNMSV